MDMVIYYYQGKHKNRLEFESQNMTNDQGLSFIEIMIVKKDKEHAELISIPKMDVAEIIPLKIDGHFNLKKDKQARNLITNF